MSNIIRDEIKRLLKETIKGSIEDVLKNLKEKPPVILTGGPCKGGQNPNNTSTKRPEPPQGLSSCETTPLTGTNLLKESEEPSLVPTTIIAKFNIGDYPKIKNTLGYEEFINDVDVQIELHQTHLADCEIIDVIQ